MDYTEPFFSVIIPVYNKGPHIQRSLNSVFNQTFQDIEVLIIDDASTDNSLQEIFKFNGPRMRILSRSKPGPGGYAARNLGIREARGKWIAFLDADDEWMCDHLALAYNGILSNDNICIVSAGWVVSLGSDVQKIDGYYKNNIQRKCHLYNINDYIEAHRPVYTSVAVIKKSVLQKVNGFDENWCHGADVDLWLRILLCENCVGLWLPYISAVYHRNTVNAVTSNLFQTTLPSFFSIVNYLQSNPDSSYEFQRKLKKFANKLAIKPFLRRIESSNAKVGCLNQYFFVSQLSCIAKFLISLICIFPKILNVKNFRRILYRLIR